MEFGIKKELPFYSGGLGILAGDIMKSFADKGVPAVGIGLFYNFGNVIQRLTPDGWQTERYERFLPNGQLELIPETVSMKLDGRDLNIRAWKHVIKGRTGEVPIYFLDTEGCGNKSYDEFYCGSLYNGQPGTYHRLCPEAILGIGGVGLLEKLKIYPKIYHLNEGHTSLVTLARMNKLGDSKRVKEETIFATHTPVAAGHDWFPYDLTQRVLPSDISQYIGQDGLHMTLLGMNLSRDKYCVSKLHAAVSREMFPGQTIDSITNGVHTGTWTGPEFKKLFDEYDIDWRDKPEQLREVNKIPVEQIVEAHYRQKLRLFRYIKETQGIELDPSKLTIGFARRAASYKRTDMLVQNMEELKRVCRDTNLIFAGKAHPDDNWGKDMIKNVKQAGYSTKGKPHIIFIEDYNMQIGALMTQGVDVWLNNPIKPHEACGTSGMKAACNGGLNLSVRDGWWDEGCIEGVTGWEIEGKPEENAKNLMEKLEHVVIPTKKRYPSIFGGMMQATIAENASYFNTHRVVDELLKVYRL